MRTESSLTAELERLALHELLSEWKRLNWSHFRDRMRTPVFALSDSSTLLGQWSLRSRTIEISRVLLRSQPWNGVVEVLKHEMAHQFVHEVIGVEHETPHGPRFQALCRELGIDARARGYPRANPSTTEHHMASRVMKLLALSESPNAHEAEAAMMAAQRLIAKYNIEPTQHAELEYAYRTLGEPTGRTQEHERLVGNILADHFFVEVIWVPAYRPLEGKRGSVLEICGRVDNLDMAEYVHGYLHGTAERLWEENKKELGLTGNRERRTFLSGVMSGFLEKLRVDKKKATTRGEIVWVRDGHLDQFFQRRHPHVRHVRYGGQVRGEAFSAGKQAGASIDLGRPVRQGTGPKLLRSGR